MQFVQRLRTIWSWLPAFRAVAETEHLPTAAHELGIVPSSVSRAVKLLEDELGVALFERATKGLVLNPAGRALLTAVREAMRLVDDALGVVISDELRGDVRAVATSDFAHALLVPAASLLAGHHPQLIVSVSIGREDEVAGMLVRGDADVAIVAAAPSHADLVAIELATWTRGVYACSAAPESRCVIARTSIESDDGWPDTTERVIGAWAPDERAALVMSGLGGFATVAYDVIARMSGLTLVRHEAPAIPSRTLHLVHRRPIAVHRRTDAMLAAIREVAVTIDAR